MSRRDAPYWEKRRLDLLARLERDEEALYRRLGKVYATEIAKLERDIAAYYREYGEDGVVAYRRLLAGLSERDRRLIIEQMEEFAEKYPQHAHLMPVRESIYRLNEMEGIQLSMRIQQLRIGAIEEEEVTAHLEKLAQRSANLAAEQMGFGTAFYAVDASVVKAAVGVAWAQGESFSQRIWGNRQKLAAYLADDFAKAIARGASYERIARDMADRFESASDRNIRRLVYTEGTYVFNEAHAQAHEQHYTHYSLSTVTDGRACDQCRGVERATASEPALFEERTPGVNFPPLHPYCRCSYKVVVERDERIEQQAARGGESSSDGGRSAGSLDAFGGSFGGKLDDVRTEYASSSNVARTLSTRHGVSVEIENSILDMGKDQLVAVMSAVDYGMTFVGGHARNLKLVAGGRLDDDEVARITRRRDDAVIKIDVDKLAAADPDRVEQVVFHEMAHTAEWKFTDADAWDEEVDDLLRWRVEGGRLLNTSSGSEVIDCLMEAGFKVSYRSDRAIIVFDEPGALEASEISDYALYGAQSGTQLSELIAESVRYVAVNGYGKNKVADAIARRFL